MPEMYLSIAGLAASMEETMASLDLLLNMSVRNVWAKTASYFLR